MLEPSGRIKTGENFIGLMFNFNHGEARFSAAGRAGLHLLPFLKKLLGDDMPENHAENKRPCCR